MMISYLGFVIGFRPQAVFQYNMAGLPHLVRFCPVPFGLQVQDLLHAFLVKDMMTSSHPLAESEDFQHTPQSVEGNVGVERPPQNPFKHLLRRHHAPLSRKKIITITQAAAHAKSKARGQVRKV